MADIAANCKYVFSLFRHTNQNHLTQISLTRKKFILGPWHRPYRPLIPVRERSLRRITANLLVTLIRLVINAERMHRRPAPVTPIIP